MIAFGMKTTLVRFQDQYYNYKGVVEDDMGRTSKDGNGLAIGAFEAVFCANTGTYQNNGLIIFDGWKTVNETIRWVHDFQLQ
eukprot:7651629-Ditylum_brightwellii.AAC.1